MVKNAIFQVHWFLGITAGLVLAVVGVTGAMLSFEHDLLKAMNAGVMTVPVQGRAPLAPAELLARIARAEPGKAIASLTLSSVPGDSARVGFAPPPGAAPGPGGRARGETRYVDPYSGALLAAPRGEGFFRTTMQIHRWLAADEIGKQIVGFSTLALVFFCLSGLYLRWPRKWLDWRAWLKLEWAQKGRSFLWHLHSIVGTWVVVAYLVMALTGLFWSYEWYRSGLYAMTGTPVPAQRGGPSAGGGAKPGGDSAMRREGSARGVAGSDTAPAPAPALDLAAAFAAFEAAVPARSTLTLRLPTSAGQPLEFGYQDPDPAHERANNRLVLDAATLAVTAHERYDDKPAGQKIMASIFPLHSGSYFGLPGLVLFALASLAMPLFAVTGWMLYLDRRKKKRAVRRAAAAHGSAPAPGAATAHAPAATQAGGDDIVVAHASQTGTAEGLAWQTAGSLQAAGQRVRVLPLATLDAPALAAIPRLLVVASTFGEGEPPDALRAFARRVLTAPAALPGLRYAVLALGDRSYEHFCGFGRDVDRWLRHAGATPLFDRVEVDDGDPGALRHWQQQLGALTGHADVPDWIAPRYDDWTLVAREHLNPGSPGGEVHRLALASPPVAADWQAGDIAEIGVPGHSHREYSIASLPADGHIELLVRRMAWPDGRLGAASAWLTRDAAPGAAIALRVRRNPGFRPPADDRPLVLVGNGTGIAGLRSVLKARIAAGHRRNWLLFGERTAAHDFHFGDELRAAHAAGWLEHLDLAFSRDQPERAYVQHCLRRHSARLREWLAQGADVMVCGSLAGMAPGVHAVLAEAVGADALERLAASGRYRRDVY